MLDGSRAGGAGRRGGIEAGETIIKIYCDVKKATFNKKGSGKTDARNEKKVGSHGAGPEMVLKH